MTEQISIHPVNPEPRKLQRVADVIRRGGLVVYPTDSCYAFGFHMGDKAPIKEIQRIRQTDKKHNFTLVCRDLSEIAAYAKVDNWCYRSLKAHTPGPYTFILQSTRDLPRRLQNEKRKTVGIRIPEHPITQALLEELGEPLRSSTLIMPGDEWPMTDCDEMAQRLRGEVDLIVDGGSCGIEPTTVIDLTGSFPVILREGKGSTEDFK